MKEIQGVRLIADEDKVLTNGTVTGKVVDVFPAENKEQWSEIDDPNVEKESEEDTNTEDPSEQINNE
jgi:hypothetical protein